MNDLRQNLNNHFNEQELRNLCFDLNIEYDDLGGNTKAGKVRELLAYVGRHGFTAALHKYLKKVRPHILWDTLFSNEGYLQEETTKSKSAVPSKTIDSGSFSASIKMAPLPSSWVAQNFSDREFNTYMTFLRSKIVFLHDPIVIGGGLSGARTLSVHVAPNNQLIPQGHYVLKICQPAHANREIKEHRVAENKPALGKHVPHIALALENPTKTLTGIFYQVAGNSLLTAATLQDVLIKENQSPPQLHQIAQILLTDSMPQKNINGKQENIIQAIKSGLEDYRLKDLRERLTNIVRNPLCARIEGEPLPQNEWKSNPLPYLLDEIAYPIPQKQFLFRGKIHGDLHPANIIVPAMQSNQDISNDPEAFWLIDFALAREGNALFDLAYLELSLLLTLFEGHTKKALQQWWTLEKHLSRSLDIQPDYTGVISPGIIKPIRKALVQRANKDGMLDSYQVTFLAASVEAGLNFARKLQDDLPRQRIAFLTAVSRFDRLLELLNIKKHKGQIGILLPLNSPIQTPAMPKKAKNKQYLLSMTWPMAVSGYKNLYDPRHLVKDTVNALLSEEGQSVLLLGERISGKSSFLNGVRDYTTTYVPNPVWDLYIGTQNLPRTANILAKAIITGICRHKNVPFKKVGLQLDNKGGFLYDVGQIVDVCHNLIPPHSDTKAILFIDEVDSMFKDCVSGEAEKMLGLIARLATDPALQSFRVLLTASESSALKLKQKESKSDLFSSIKKHPIYNLSQEEMGAFIERLAISLPLSFNEASLQHIYQYTGGSYYLTKFMMRLVEKHPHVQAGKYAIDPQIVEEAISSIIRPDQNDYAYADLHNDLFDTLENIYEIHFSENEKQFAEWLASIEGNGSPNSSTHKQGADSLYKRGYLHKEYKKGKPVYHWQIGFWKAFLVEQYELQSSRQSSLDINKGKGLIHLNGVLFGPTKQQRQLLYHMGQRAGQLVTYDDLVEHVWEDKSGDVSDQAIAASISRLRKALAAIDPNTMYIETITGQGFILHHACYTE